MLTNKQLIIIGAFALAAIAIIVGYDFEAVVRALSALLLIG